MQRCAFPISAGSMSLSTVISQPLGFSTMPTGDTRGVELQPWKAQKGRLDYISYCLIELI